MKDCSQNQNKLTYSLLKCSSQFSCSAVLQSLWFSTANRTRWRRIPVRLFPALRGSLLKRLPGCDRFESLIPSSPRQTARRTLAPASLARCTEASKQPTDPPIAVSQSDLPMRYPGTHASPLPSRQSPESSLARLFEDIRPRVTGNGPRHQAFFQAGN